MFCTTASRRGPAVNISHDVIHSSCINIFDRRGSTVSTRSVHVCVCVCETQRLGVEVYASVCVVVDLYDLSCCSASHVVTVTSTAYMVTHPSSHNFLHHIQYTTATSKIFLPCSCSYFYAGQTSKVTYHLKSPKFMEVQQLNTGVLL